MRKTMRARRVRRLKDQFWRRALQTASWISGRNLAPSRREAGSAYSSLIASPKSSRVKSMLLSEKARQNKAEASREYVLLDAVRP